MSHNRARQADRDNTETEKDKAVRTMDQQLEAEGCITEVGSDFYQTFIGTTDEAMSAMIRFIIYDRGDEINKHIENKTLDTPKLQSIVSSMLNLALKLMPKLTWQQQHEEQT